MLLIGAIAVLAVVVLLGGWLGAQYLLLESRPTGLHWQGALHGATGLAGFVLLVFALRGPSPSLHAIRMGVGSFGQVAGALIAGALLAGGTILLMHLRRRPISDVLVAAHGLLGIVGYTLLVTYLTMLH